MCVMILIGSGSGYSQIRITAHSQSIKEGSHPSNKLLHRNSIEITGIVLLADRRFTTRYEELPRTFIEPTANVLHTFQQ